MTKGIQEGESGAVSTWRIAVCERCDLAIGPNAIPECQCQPEDFGDWATPRTAITWIDVAPAPTTPEEE